MAISIDWGTKVISVPKADLTLVQSTPTEIRQLDLNSFHLELRSLESTEDGMPNLITHNHNTEVLLGGITFARVIEIINGYTVTFEDGQYAVNLIGANSNVGDNVNVNQVSVRSQNSAGLISSPLIEYASFEGGVWIDTDNGTDGTLHPIGTRLQPTNNLTDAKIIADYRGFNNIFILSDNLDLDEDIDFGRFIFKGQTHVNNNINIQSIVGVEKTVFSELTVTGTLDGGNELDNCIINDLNYVNGHIHSCGLIGDISLSGSSNAIFSDCKTIDPYDPPIIDMGASGQNLIMPNYVGLLTIKNMSGNNFIGIGLMGGEVTLDNTITNGTVHISGVGVLKDSNGDLITSGTWNNNVTIINTCVSNESISSLYPTTSDIADEIWNAQTSEHQVSGSFGEIIQKIKTWVNYIRNAL